MKNLRWWSLCLGVPAGLAALALALAGCDGDSTVTKNLDMNIAGVYRNPGGNLVANNSGAPVKQMNLTQQGDQITGVDNNGVVFRGQLTGENDAQSSLVLRGNTTTGGEATISGQIAVRGNKAFLQGTWIEPTLYSTVYGEADVVGIITNAPPNTNLTNFAKSL
jgi:hypothetical protein